VLDIPPADLASLAKDVHMNRRMISDVGTKHESPDLLLAQLLVPLRQFITIDKERYLSPVPHPVTG